MLYISTFHTQIVITYLINFDWLEQSLNTSKMKTSIFAIVSTLVLAATAAPARGQNAQSAVPDCVSTQSCADGIHAPADKREPAIPGFDPESIRKTLESPAPADKREAAIPGFDLESIRKTLESPPPADKRAPPIPGFDPESIRKTLDSPLAQD